jgi:cytochrome P450
MDEFVGKGRPVEEYDCLRMPYLQAVINETFRLHAPAPLLIPHFTAKATTLRGFHVPANTTVLINLRVIARDPLLWKNPEKFEPERFLSPENISLTDGNDFRLFPFGSGRRKCPAALLGHLIVLRTVATLVHAFDWSPLKGKITADIDSTESMTGLARPKVPLVLRAKPRLNPDIYSQFTA